MSLDALMAALNDEHAATALRGLDGERALTALIPELEEGREFKQSALHYYTVLEHQFAAVAVLDDLLEESPASRELREALPWINFEASFDTAVDGIGLKPLLKLAGLLHDVAKPMTATMIEGRLRFPRHGPLGAELMTVRLREIGLGAEAADFVARMIRYHLRPAELVRSQPVSDRAMRRFVRDLDGHVLPLMLLNVADGWATRGPGYTRENFRRHLRFLEWVVARAVEVFAEAEEPLLSGEDLMAELDLESGRLLGAVLTSVRRAQAAGTISNRDEALDLARERLASLQQHRENG